MMLGCTNWCLPLPFCLCSFLSSKRKICDNLAQSPNMIRHTHGVDNEKATSTRNARKNLNFIVTLSQIMLYTGSRAATVLI